MVRGTSPSRPADSPESRSAPSCCKARSPRSLVAAFRSYHALARGSAGSGALPDRGRSLLLRHLQSHHCTRPPVCVCSHHVRCSSFHHRLDV
ncbi:hypothetical protein F7725_019920, partial [Dissostichus mawsoni]